MVPVELKSWCTQIFPPVELQILYRYFRNYGDSVGLSGVLRRTAFLKKCRVGNHRLPNNIHNPVHSSSLSINSRKIYAKNPGSL